jgi:diguanylate cyclase (GGDEF)-like protein/PAS domain S-box-containing protein
MESQAAIRWDESARKTALIGGQGRVLEMIATGAPFRETLDALVRTIEADSPDLIASILLLDEDGSHLRHGAAPSLPAEYNRAIDGGAIGPRAGSCGTAAFRREQVIAADIQIDPLWADYRELAAAHGLRACWSTPIFDGSRRVLGTFALYFRTPALPTDRHAQLIELATHTAAIAIVNMKNERERTTLMHALYSSESLFRSIFENAAIGVTVTDNQRRLVKCNPAFARLLGCRADEIIGKPFAEFTHPDDVAANEESYRALVAGEIDHFALDKRYLRKDGSIAWVRLTVSQVPPDATTEPFTIGMMEDITARKQAEARIQYLATHDGLTDIPNRNLMQDRIVQAIAHARRSGREIALMYVDLDRFKVVNEGFGHPFGDAVLRAVAERLKSVVRESDAIARHSGDEFLILLADLRKPADVYIVAQKTLDALAQPFSLQQREVFLGASIGVSIFPRDADDAENLVANANAAMYRAKDLGHNTYQFFTREMSDEVMRRVNLENELRLAVSRNELHLAYQPKVDLASGRVTGCEALLRWRHPTLGAVSPAQFIPVAEESGLIVPIGDWVLHTACSQCREWADAGLPPLAVAVNLSARQFLQQDVVAWVIGVLKETGLAPHRLELELTESIIAQDTEKVIATISQLEAQGVRHSIDDFGTGYSSLSYLKRFRVDTLKIDQSFVRHMLTERDDAAIVHAVISLGHSLRMKVIAEGVETSEHCALLRRHGCDEMQGYYFSKPLAAKEFAELLASGKHLPLALP